MILVALVFDNGRTFSVEFSVFISVISAIHVAQFNCFIGIGCVTLICVNHGKYV